MTPGPPTSRSSEEGEVVHLRDDTFIDLVLGLLPEEPWNRAAAHLKSCSRCERRLRRRATEIERLRVSPTYQAILTESTLPVSSGAAGAVERAAASTGVEIPAMPTARAGMPAAPGSRELGDASLPERILSRISSAAHRPRFALRLAVAAAAVAVVAVLIRHPHRSIPIPSEVDWLPSAAEFSELRDAAPLSGGGDRHGATPLEVERAQAELAHAVAAYDRRDLPEAIRELRSMKSDGALEAIREIYLANARLQQGDNEEAVPTLRSVLREDLPARWSHECQWMLLVGLSRTGHPAGADSLLHTLAAEPGPYGDRARRLLSGHAH